jgi:hypothetical protein
LNAWDKKYYRFFLYGMEFPTCDVMLVAEKVLDFGAFWISDF